MGAMDKQLVFSDKQTLAAGDSTNTLDFKYKFNNTGGFLQLHGHGVTGSTAVTVTVKESDDGSTWADRETMTFATADFNKGTCAIALAKPLKRYAKLTYALTGAITAGTVTAFLTNVIESPNIYPTNRTG